MTSPVVVLTEEPSARIVVEEVCKNVGYADVVKVIEHDGKSDLERSIARKLNGWRAAIPARFVVSRDLDNSDRATLKTDLLEKVPAHAADRTKIRIVIPELETWYLGDPEALREAGLISEAAQRRIGGASKFRDLCALVGAKAEFKKIVGEIGQLAAAHAIAPHLRIGRNRCRNFVAFFEAVEWAVTGARADLQAMYAAQAE